MIYKNHPYPGRASPTDIGAVHTEREPYSAKGRQTKCSSSRFHPTLPLGKPGSVVVAPVAAPVTPLSDTGASLILASQRVIPSLDDLGSWSACSRRRFFSQSMAALATASAIPEFHGASPSQPYATHQTTHSPTPLTTRAVRYYVNPHRLPLCLNKPLTGTQHTRRDLFPIVNHTSTRQPVPGATKSAAMSPPGPEICFSGTAKSGQAGRTA